MKAVPIVLMLFVLCARLDAEDVMLHAFGSISRFDGKLSVKFFVPREELEKVAAWEPAEGEPAPLTRNRALEIARRAAVEQGLDLSNEPLFVVTLQKMHPNYIELLTDRPVNGCLWYYEVRFEMREDSPGATDFIVSMSGALATRKIEKEDKR